MVAMQMADEQQIEAVGRDAAALERLQQPGPGFQQDAARRRFDQIAGL